MGIFDRTRQPEPVPVVPPAGNVYKFPNLKADKIEKYKKLVEFHRHRIEFIENIIRGIEWASHG